MWLGHLELNIQTDEAQFTIEGQSDAPGWIRLPGKSGLWPVNVQINGTHATIMDHNGYPEVFVSEQTMRITGTIVWNSIPKELPIPKTIGIVSATQENKTLPIQLDCGTNNQALLHDPDYLGWHHTRITGDDYNHFIEDVVSALQKHFPSSYLHWEDFGRANARRFLEQYKHQICTFNDDIQGTAAVAIAGVLGGIKIQKPNATDLIAEMRSQKFLFHGAGSANLGVYFAFRGSNVLSTSLSQKD